MKIEEKFYSELKIIASVSERNWQKKQTRGLWARRKRFTLLAKLSEYIR